MTEIPESDKTVSFQISRERIGDLVCNALEGGSTYWLDGFKPDSYPEGTSWGHEAVAHGADFTIRFDCGEKQHVVSGSRLANALELMARKYPKHFADFLNENDDADTGDVFFQLLCFGEVVYG